MERADECRSQTAEDRDLKRSEQQADIDRDDDEHQEADNILDYAIEYCMTGSHPPDLTKDKKRVRERAKAITVTNGEVYLQRRKNKVCMVLL